MNITDSKDMSYGAAFRNKPITFHSHSEISAILNHNKPLSDVGLTVSYGKNSTENVYQNSVKSAKGKAISGVTLYENNSTLGSNNIYRNQYITYEIAGNNYKGVSLDMMFLIRDETSCLKGSLDSESDVDFYHFSVPFNRTIQNNFGIEINMDIPQGCDYNMTLYDEYGNQVAKAEWTSNGRKTLAVPNWDTLTTKYCIKIENADGKEVAPEDYYKISCHITDHQDTEKTNAIRNAFAELRSAYERKDENWRDYLEAYNKLIEEIEKDYTRELVELHKRQFENLPEDKKYKGEKTPDDLLADLANGKNLNEAEQEYLKIYANLKEYEKAKNIAGLKNSFSAILTEELTGLGISQDETDGMNIKITSTGEVTVNGIESEDIARQVKKLIEEKYSEQFYQYYIGIADSISDLSSTSYKYVTEVQEVKRYLKAVTGEDVALEQLYLTPNGKIGGLPDKASKLINDTTGNVKIEGIKENLINIIQNINHSENKAVPEFTSEFVYQNGKFSIIDNGFTVDMESLSNELLFKSSGNMYSDSYKYKFNRVL